MPADVKNRVSSLEQVLEHYIESSTKNIADLSSEMKDFKDEMKGFKDEMKGFKDEIQTFKQSSERYQEAVDKDIREMKKQWGELANKMGTLVEDIFYPGIGPTLKKYFNAELEIKGIHMLKYIKSKDLRGEFDIVAADKHRVYVVEVKSTPDRWGINKFTEERLPVFRQLFPEYDDRELVPIFGSLSFPDDLIDYATKKGIYVLAYREWEYLDILNFDAVQL